MKRYTAEFNSYLSKVILLDSDPGEYVSAEAYDLLAKELTESKAENALLKADNERLAKGKTDE